MALLLEEDRLNYSQEEGKKDGYAQTQISNQKDQARLNPDTLIVLLNFLEILQQYLM